MKWGWGDKTKSVHLNSNGKKEKKFHSPSNFERTKKIHNEKDLNISLANAENVGDEKYSVFHGKDNIKRNGAVCIREENVCV